MPGDITLQAQGNAVDVPRDGGFFMHDDRTDPEPEQEAGGRPSEVIGCVDKWHFSLECRGEY